MSEADAVPAKEDAVLHQGKVAVAETGNESRGLKGRIPQEWSPVLGTAGCTWWEAEIYR